MMDSIYQEISLFLNDYYNPSIPNECRQDAGKYLQIFISRNDCLQICIELMEKYTNKYVHLFVLSVLENILNKKWKKLSLNNKNFIKEKVYRIIFNHDGCILDEEREKLCRIFAFFGRNDFPDEFPNFLSIIDQALLNQNNIIYGVLVMETFLEELFFENSFILSTRRNQLKTICKENGGKIVGGMINYLKALFTNQVQLFAKNQTCGENKSNLGLDISSSGNFEFLAQNKLTEIRLFNLITEVVIKYMKLTLTNFKINSEFIECLLVFASIPFGCENHKNSNDKFASISLRSINDVISQESIVVNNKNLMMAIYEWSKQFLNSYETIGPEYNEFIQDAIDFFSLFIQTYYKNYFDRISCSDGLNYIKIFIKFASSQNSSSGMNLCSLTISKLQTEMISTTNMLPIASTLKNEIFSLITNYFLIMLNKIIFTYSPDLLLLSNSSEFKEFLNDHKENLRTIIVNLPYSSDFVIYDMFAFFWKDIINIFTNLKESVSCQSTACLMNLSKEYEDRLTVLTCNCCTTSYFQSSILHKLLLQQSEINIPNFYNIMNLSCNLILILIESFEDAHNNTKMSASINELKNSSLLNILECIPIIQQINTYAEENMFSLSTISNDKILEINIDAINKFLYIAIKIVKHDNKKERGIDLSCQILYTIFNKIKKKYLYECQGGTQFLNFIQEMHFIKLNTQNVCLLFESAFIFAINKEHGSINSFTSIESSTFITNLFNKYIRLFEELSNELLVRPINQVSMDINYKKYTKFSIVLKNIINLFNDQSVSLKQAGFEFFKPFVLMLISNIDKFHVELQLLKANLKILLELISTFKGHFKEGIPFILSLLSRISLQESNEVIYISEELRGLLTRELLETISVLIEFNISNCQFEETIRILLYQIYSSVKTIGCKNVHFDFCKTIIKILSVKFDFFSNEKYPQVKRCFYEFYIILLEELKTENIELIKQCSISLYDLDVKRNIYTSTIFQGNQLLYHLCMKFFMLLVDETCSNLHEDILNNIYRIAIKNKSNFYTEWIPHFLSTFVLLTTENHHFLLKTLYPPLDDQPSFCFQISNLAKDIKYFCTINDEPKLC